VRSSKLLVCVFFVILLKTRSDFYSYNEMCLWWKEPCLALQPFGVRVYKASESDPCKCSGRARDKRPTRD
jgi:hypothetical protein